MARTLALGTAIEEYVKDGVTIAMEGFTHLVPMAAAHEIVRQRRRHLRLVRMTPDLIYDQLIGMGCVAHVTFSWAGNPGVGSLHRFRDALANGWPNPITIDEHSHAALACAYDAGAAGMPFAVLRAYTGVDLPQVNPSIRSVACPFTAEVFAAVPSIRPDVTVIHAQRADRQGNVLVEGILGVQKEAVLAATHSIATVEEIVDDLGATSPNAVILPHWVVSAVVEVPGGAYPSYAHGYYPRDNAAYLAWDAIARERDTFTSWMREHVLRAGPADFARHARHGEAVSHA